MNLHKNQAKTTIIYILKILETVLQLAMWLNIQKFKIQLPFIQTHQTQLIKFKLEKMFRYFNYMH